MEFLKCFVDERFINKAQFDAGFAHRLILKDGAVPAIKDPGHDSELQMVSETASNVCVLLAIGASARHSLAPPTRHASRSSAFFGEVYCRNSCLFSEFFFLRCLFGNAEHQIHCVPQRAFQEPSKSLALVLPKLKFAVSQY